MRPALIIFVLLAASVVPAQTPATPTDGVIRFLEQRLQRDPDDFMAAGKLGETYLQKAREGGPIDCYAKAEKMFRLVLNWVPESYPMRASLASTLVSQHRFRDAASLAGKLTAEYPNEVAAHGVLGDALLEIGDLPGAAMAYTKLMSLEPGLAAYSRLARLDWLQGKTSSAISNFTAALQFSNSPPESLAWACVQKGELLFRTGRLAEAEDEYEAALKIFPAYFLALDHIAELRAAQGRFDEAAKTFQQLADKTRRPEYLQAIGDVFTAERKADAAKSFYERALSEYLRGTTNGQVHYFHHLASFYADVRSDGLEAERWARRDLEGRKSGYAWDALAWALFWKKDYEGAREAMSKALASGTNDTQLLAHAGSIFVRAGRIKEGQEYMRRAREANPRFSDFHVHR